MNSELEDGRGLRQPALVNHAPTGHGPTGFDPARDDAFWGPEIVVNGDKPEWLAPHEPFVWINTSRWLETTRRPCIYKDPFAADTAQWHWRHSSGVPCILAIRLPADHPAYSRDSRSKPDRAETGTGSVHESDGAGTAIARKEVP